MYLRLDQLKGIPFKHLGKNVRISDKCSIYNPENISIGDDTRIDDFTVLSAGEGGIEIGKRVHIGCYSSLIGAGIIQVFRDTEISGRVSIYSSTNDFREKSFYGDDGKRMNIFKGYVVIGAAVVIGCGSVVLPLVAIEQGARVGALSLVKDDIGLREIWAGVPAKKIGQL